MIYDTEEYELLLEIPTDNFVVFKFQNQHTENMFDFISNVKTNITNNSTLVVIFGLFQNLYEYDHWFEPLNNFANSIPNPIIVFNGRLSHDPWRKIQPQFAYRQLGIFDHISNYFWNKNIKFYNHHDWVNDVYREKKHKFYWASTKDWYTRRFVLAGLINNHLHHQNLINYKCLNSHIPSDYLNSRFDNETHQIIIEECDSIQNLVPLPPIDENISFENTPIEFYNTSYLGIVTDTFFDSGIFLSEKIFNAMNYQQLFFYIGPNYTLKYLKSLGYYTFDDIIDTSYDDIENAAHRLFAARKSLLDFLQQPIEKIRDAYIKSIPGIQHNKNLVSQQRPDIKFTQAIESVLNEH